MLLARLPAVGVLATASLLAACAAPVPVAPATLARLDRPHPDLVMPARVRVDLPTGRARALPQGSIWRAVGTMPQGVVYQPVDTVFTIVGRGVKHQDMVGSLPSLKPGHGRIYFYRPTSVVLATLASEVKLNNEVVGESRVGGFFFIDRPAGNYLAATSTEVERSVSFSLAPGETKYVRMYVIFGVAMGRISLEVVPPAQGRSELASLSYIGKPVASK